MAWWKTSTFAYVNSDQIGSIWVTGVGSTWYIHVWFPEADQDIALEGQWTTQAAAMEAARQLVQGFTPGDLG